MPWMPWEPLGGQIVGDPTVLARGPDQWDVFAEGTDGQLWQLAWRTSRWTDWHRPDQEQFTLGSSPVVASSGDDVQVFARGQDGQLWRKIWTAGTGWQPWAALGGALVGKPAAAGNSEVFDVIVRGRDDKLHGRTWLGDHWTGWAPLADSIPVAGSPVAVVQRDGIAIYVRGTDGHVWTTARDGGAWRPWTSLGGELIGDPAAVRFDPIAGSSIYVRDLKNGLQSREQPYLDGPWLEWSVFPDTSLASSPTAAGDFTTWANRQIYARGVDGQLWRKHFVPADAIHSRERQLDTATREFTNFLGLSLIPMFAGTPLYEGTFPGIPGAITGPILRISVPGALGPGYSVFFGKPGTSPDGSWASVDSGGALEGARLAQYLNPGKTSVSLRAASTLPARATLELTVTYISTDHAATSSRLSALSPALLVGDPDPRPLFELSNLASPENERLTPS